MRISYNKISVLIPIGNRPIVSFPPKSSKCYLLKSAVVHAPLRGQSDDFGGKLAINILSKN